MTSQPTRCSRSGIACGVHRRTATSSSRHWSTTSRARKRRSAPTLWPVVRNWTERVDNWCHADGLSALYSWILASEPDAVYPQLRKWNRAEDLWLRRISLVSLIHYSGKNAVFVPSASRAAARHGVPARRARIRAERGGLGATRDGPRAPGGRERVHRRAHRDDLARRVAARERRLKTGQRARRMSFPSSGPMRSRESAIGL